MIQKLQFLSTIHFRNILLISTLMGKELYIMAQDIEIHSDCIINIHLKRIAINLTFLNPISREIQECFKICLQALRNRQSRGGQIYLMMRMMEKLIKKLYKIKISTVTKINLTLKVMETIATKAIFKAMKARTKAIQVKKTDELSSE